MLAHNSSKIIWTSQKDVETHVKSKQHKLAEEQKLLSKRLFAKGNVHSPMVKRRKQQVKKIKNATAVW